MSDQLMSSLGARLQLIDESFRDGVAGKYLDGYGLPAAFETDWTPKNIWMDMDCMQRETAER